MTDIAKLTVQFEAETAKFRKQLEQNNRTLEGFRRKTEKQLGFVRQAFAVGLGTGLADSLKRALTAAPRFLQNTLDQADSLQKLNIRLGASTEALSQYKLVADRSGVAFETLTMGWQRMTRQVAEAAQGTGEARGALAELGVDVQALAELAPDQQFEALADAMQSVENPADRVRLAMKLFGAESVRLLQTMEGGSEAIRGVRAEADAMGLTLGQDTADAAARANDAMGDLSKGVDALGLTFITHLAPAITSVAEWLQETIPSAAQVAADAFYELQRFIQQAGNFVTGALAGIEYGLSDAASAVGADQLARAFRKAGDDYAEMAGTFERAAIRIEKAKVSIPELGAAIGGIDTSTIFDPARGVSLQDQKASGKRKTGRTDAEKERDRLLAESQRMAEQQYQELQRVIAEVDPVAPLLKQLDALEDLNAAYPEYADIIAEAMLNVQEEIDKANGGLEEQQDEIDKTGEMWKSFGEITSSAFEDAIVEGRKFGDVLKGLEQDILRLVIRNQVTNPLSEKLGGFMSGSGIGEFFSGLLPFATGGSFTVGGAGGTDSQLVAFRASPDERVTVETPRQQAARGNTFNFSFVLPTDTVDHRRTAQHVAREAARMMRVAQGAV